MVYKVALKVLELTRIIIHSSKIAEIARTNSAQIAIFEWDKVCIEIFSKYAEFVDIFSPNLTIELPKNIGINKYIIEQVDGK